MVRRLLFGNGLDWRRPMPSFNFKPEFVAPILAGTKVQTIRKTARCKTGDTMHLFTGLRTAACQKLAERLCVVVDYVHLSPDGLTVGDNRKHPRDISEFARLDGFTDFDDMLRWFRTQYGEYHFIGYVHRWAKETADV